MRTFSEQTIGRTDGASSGLPGITRLFGAMLFLALLQGPVQAAQTVTLGWNPSPGTPVVGYNVYYGVASHTYTGMFDAGNATSAGIRGLVEGGTYFFAVTAYAAIGLESDFSSEISYTVPGGLPRVQLRVTSTGQVVLTVIGQAGHTFDIQATQTLNTWTVIGRVTLGAGGSVEFTDPNAAGSQKRFYRTRDTQL
jgi:hypothetical protein